MDSKAYKYLIAKIIEGSEKLSSSLPVQFTSRNITLNEDTLKAVSYFLKDCILESGSDQSGDLPPPGILKASDDNFFSILFRFAHQKLAEVLSEGGESTSPTFKYNGTELLKLLCHASSPKWFTVFSSEDVSGFALSCFLIEAFINIGWCPNAFEGRAKRAAHIYFSNLKKSLYKVTDAELSTILGYLQSAWLCAQKTEGIQDRAAEWENKDRTFHYSWDISINDTNIKSDFTMYRYPHNAILFIVPKCNNRLPHPFTNLVNENKTGLKLFSEGKQIIPTELVENTPIERRKIKGERFIYNCMISPSLQIQWLVAIQVFENTIYRIDVIRPKTGTCIVTDSELRIENSIQLLKISENKYEGKGYTNAVIELLKNPFSLDYSGQEEDDISLFKGRKKTPTAEVSVEMITAWSFGKDINSIDKTNLLGIFNLPSN